MSLLPGRRRYRFDYGDAVEWRTDEGWAAAVVVGRFVRPDGVLAYEVEDDVTGDTHETVGRLLRPV